MKFIDFNVFKKKKDVLFIVMILLIIILLCMYFYRRDENFENSDIYIDNTPEDIKDANQTVNKRIENCNAYLGDNSFCQFDEDLDKCVCKYQKDSVKYALPSQVPCCDRLCSLLPKEKCMKPDNLKEVKYYCNVGGNCLERQATIRENKISANNCGTESLNNQLILPYMTKDECERSKDPCDKYNQEGWSESEKRDKCLKDPNCGYCTNENNVGKCIGGTISGPNDLMKYYYCVPERTQSNYQYTYGNHADALNISNLLQYFQ